MKKFIIPLIVAVLVAMLLPVAAMMASAEKETGEKADAQNETVLDDDALITYGYLQTFKEELRQEILEELATEGGITITSEYEDISAKAGEMILLSANCEVIYRGGGAVAVTSSNSQNEGITNMSSGAEIFSGESLEYGNVYYASASESKKAILITGSNAYFTVRGDYEIV